MREGSLRSGRTGLLEWRKCTNPSCDTTFVLKANSNAPSWLIELKRIEIDVKAFCHEVNHTHEAFSKWNEGGDNG